MGANTFVGKFPCIILTCITISLAVPGFSADGKIELVKDGKSDYAIVIPANAIPSEQRAARELQSALKQMSGADLPIQKDSETTPAKAIVLGTLETNAFMRSVKDPISSTGLGAEGFKIRRFGPYLLIGGGRTRGVMYGVYSFLEDDLGCRWYSEKVSYIPKKKTIALPATDRTEIPSFEYREPYYTEAMDKDWAARNRCNGNFAHLDEETGGKIGYQPFVHSFNNIISIADYWTSHPEYFSEVNGERLSSRTQLCLTNPDVLDIAKRKVDRWIRKFPEAQMISVSQNDVYNPCMCTECKKVYDATGSHSGQMLTFVNAIAEDVAKNHPGKLIDTLAYQYTEKPPNGIVPAPNVRVRLAPIDNCFGHPIDTCERNKNAFANLEAWSSKTQNLYIWHYNTNFGNYPIPFPDFDELQGSTRAYYKLGIKGIFFQGVHAPGGGGEFAELRSWVLSKILWNAKRDVWPLIDDFLKGYYGDAAQPIRQYMDMMHAAVREENLHFKINEGAKHVSYMKRKLIRKADSLFAQAEGLVQNDPEVLDRVQKARFSIDYALLMLAKDKDEKARYLEVVTKKIHKYGIQQIVEGQPVSKWLASVSKN